MMFCKEIDKECIGLISILLLLFLAGWLIYDARFQREIKSVTNETKNELKFNSVLIEERLQKRNYQLANNFVLNWGQSKPEIVEIVLTTRNGFELAHYSSPQKSTHKLMEVTEIPYSYDSLAILKLYRSIDIVYVHKKYFMYQLLAGYFLIAAILSFLVYINIRTQQQKKDLVYEVKRRKQTEVSLREREQNLNVTLNSIADAVITTDVAGNITRMNPVAIQLTGWSFEEAKGQSLKIIFPVINATTREPIANPVEKVLAKGETVYLSNHTTLISKDGTEHQIADSAAPIRDGGKILGMVLVFNDVTEQYLLREAAAESKRDLQAIIDNSPAVIYVKDTQGRYTFINQQFEKLFRMQRKKIIGKTDYDIFPVQTADEFKCNYKAVLEAGHVLESEDVSSQDDGPHTYFSVRFPLFNDMGHAYAVCSISTDITERRRQEEQLRRSQKMDALGKLTGGIAHDYNNLLGIIMGYAEQLNGHLARHSMLSKYAHEIHHAAVRGAKLTKKLLDFSRHKPFDKERMDINSLLQDQRLMLEKTLTARIKLVYDLADNLWPVEVDVSDLDNAIVNMNINAMHAMESGGQLTIQTRNLKLNTMDSQLLHLDAGDYVSLSIIDTGCGMDEATKDKIFDPFFSTKGKKGTGLGLSQVYGFVERSGGKIKVYSRPGHGSRFVFYFPRSHHAVTAVQAPTMFSRRNLDGTETLLVVDDEQSIVELAHAILITRGYHVFTANDGEQALAILERESVDLLISDVIMPGMDGYQLAARVQQRYPRIKIQLVSGFEDDSQKQMNNKALHQNMIYKPYTSNELLERVRYLLDEGKTIDKLAGRTILVMDDDETERELFNLNLSQLGCHIIEAADGDEAITLYQQSLRSDEHIDAVIMDLSVSGEAGGKELAAKILSMDPGARMIAASGHSVGSEITHYQDYGFCGALDKIPSRENIKKTLERALSTH